MPDQILKAAIDGRLFGDKTPWALFYDLDELERRYARLEQAFPADALHAVAIKANPLSSILEILIDCGAGLEAASSGELALAKKSGAHATHVVFDSPAKTNAELEAALAAGIYINVDNLDEIERIAAIDPPADCRVGVRINPVVGAGDIASTSVSTETSKFGISLVHKQRALLDAFRRHKWLRGLHVHTGSQGLGLSLLVEGVKRCVDFADRVETAVGEPRIDTIDIGGGLPVAYRPHASVPTIDEYGAALRRQVPKLFERRRQIITEFGRWLHAPCAIAASRVEYLKESPQGPVAIIHFGADLMLRTAYRPQDWYHRIGIYDPDGNRRTADEVELTVAGPLCFSGDVIARRRRLPAARAQDFVVARDVGAYTFSMWSRYCSRSFPPVFGVRHRNNRISFETLHPGESPEDVADFW